MGRSLITVVLAMAMVILTVVRTTVQQPPVFRSGVNLIQLDVSVLDKESRPVRGLSASDFEVLEDGKPQRIVAFTSVDVPAPAQPGAVWLRDVSADVVSNQGANSRVFLILLDDATIPFEAQMMETAKRTARNIVNGMGPGDLAAVVFTADNRNALDFTGDRQRLLAAINTFRAGWHSHAYQGVTNPDVYFQSLPPTALVRAVEFLSEITERRKVLVFISSGTSTPSWYDVNRLYRLAQGANVSIYPVDPSGFGLADYIQGRLLMRRARADTAMETGFQIARRRQEKLRSLATNTGGHAVMNTNDFEAGVSEILAQTSAYYLIGYESSQRKDAFRRTEVRVKRDGVETMSRRGTWAPPASRKRAATLAEDAIVGVLPKSDLPLGVHLAPLAQEGKASAVIVAIDLAELPAQVRAAPALNVVIGAYDPEGREKGMWRRQIPVPRPGADAEPLAIELKPGRYAIRVGVNPEGLPTSGSVYSEVIVPDVAKAPLALSGVVVSLTPDGSGIPPALTSLLPGAPTARRSFAGTQRATTFLRAYQGDGDSLVPMHLDIRIVNARNDTVFETQETVPADRFNASRAAHYRLDIPLARLAPGAYLLTFTARTDRATVVRHVPFAVQQR